MGNPRILEDELQVYEALAQTLIDEGVSDLFGLIGDGNLFLVDAFTKKSGTRYVSAAHETGAVLMAKGYASVTGRVGVATVTYGPAVSNTVTALIECARDGVPVVLIAGDTAAEDRHNLQNLPQRDIILPTGAGFEQVRSSETATADLATALRRAAREQGPIVLNVPVDLQNADVAYSPAPSVPRVSPFAHPSREAVEDAVAVIAASSRPIILAGRGATSAGGSLERLSERIGAPLATTLRSRDLFRHSPYNLGIFGTLSTTGALSAIGQSDCIIVFGASLNVWTTDKGALLAGKRIVHVDRRFQQLASMVTPTAGVVGDSAAAAGEFLEVLDEAGVGQGNFRDWDLSWYQTRRYTRPLDDAAPIQFPVALDFLEEAVPESRTLIADAGRFFSPAMATFRVQRPQDFVHTANIGSIGLGMGSAVGAAVGRPESPALLVCGDGGFMHGGLAEFNTAVRHGLDLIVLVFNDGGYGAEHIQFRDRAMDPSLSLLEWPQFAQLADALGGRGITVRIVGDLDDAAQAIKERDGALLIDVMLDPDSMTRPER
ncbi:thiamine pyrophosphate-binding protein [Salinibacterium sp. ZJ454]|uniref:thiamine pyrophosphate-binding protein n=1 Tax=Salinibacterium sp. ZJ454 TaxID=2708339 RepID=UPI0014229AC0|nr:thiamine pyrophosphate-binding protein [Salinibacterium sp. ZJ454]